jgi:hypothetical protein
MGRIRRWWRRGRLVWSEPARPPWLKVNPGARGTDGGLQPGETTMGMDAQEFLESGNDSPGAS